MDSSKKWSKYAKEYEPVKIGSIDGTDTEPHDHGIVRALNCTYYTNCSIKGNPKCTIFVSNLNHKTRDESLLEKFSIYGKVKRLRLVKDIVTGLSKGYGFIEYETIDQAAEAYKKAYRSELDGNILFVDYECERVLKGWKPRRLGGGFGGRKESGQIRFGGRDRPFKRPIEIGKK